MDLYLKGGNLLVLGGALATSSDCCCGGGGGACCQFSVTPPNLLFWPPNVEPAPCEEVSQEECEKCLCYDNAIFTEVDCSCEYVEAVTVPVLAALGSYQPGDMVYYHTCPPCGGNNSPYAHRVGNMLSPIDVNIDLGRPFYVTRADECITVKRYCVTTWSARPVVDCMSVGAPPLSALNTYINFANYHSGLCGTWNPEATCDDADPCNPNPFP